MLQMDSLSAPLDVHQTKDRREKASLDIDCKKHAYTKGGKGYRRVVVHTPAARSFSIQQRSPDLALVGTVVLGRLLAVALREPEVEVARCYVG